MTQSFTSADRETKILRRILIDRGTVVFEGSRPQRALAATGGALIYSMYRIWQTLLNFLLFFVVAVLSSLVYIVLVEVNDILANLHVASSSVFNNSLVSFLPILSWVSYSMVLVFLASFFAVFLKEFPSMPHVLSAHVMKNPKQLFSLKNSIFIFVGSIIARGSHLPTGFDTFFPMIFITTTLLIRLPSRISTNKLSIRQIVAVSISMSSSTVFGTRWGSILFAVGFLKLSTEEYPMLFFATLATTVTTELFTVDPIILFDEKLTVDLSWSFFIALLVSGFIIAFTEFFLEYLTASLHKIRNRVFAAHELWFSGPFFALIAVFLIYTSAELSHSQDLLSQSLFTSGTIENVSRAAIVLALSSIVAYGRPFVGTIFVAYIYIGCFAGSALGSALYESQVTIVTLSICCGGAFLTAYTQLPLAVGIAFCEIFSFSLSVPLFIICVITSQIRRLLGPSIIDSVAYDEGAIPQWTQPPIESKVVECGLLIKKPVSIRQQTNVVELGSFLFSNDGNVFSVTDPNGSVVGVATRSDLERLHAAMLEFNAEARIELKEPLIKTDNFVIVTCTTPIERIYRLLEVIPVIVIDTSPPTAIDMDELAATRIRTVIEPKTDTVTEEHFIASHHAVEKINDRQEGVMRHRSTRKSSRVWLLNELNRSYNK
ncbi:hypothetical protein PCE1_003601 [Barthelona sp. PCE]